MEHKRKTMISRSVYQEFPNSAKQKICEIENIQSTDEHIPKQNKQYKRKHPKLAREKIRQSSKIGKSIYKKKHCRPVRRKRKNVLKMALLQSNVE